MNCFFKVCPSGRFAQTTNSFQTRVAYEGFVGEGKRGELFPKINPLDVEENLKI
jgi:hypothetical protein